MFLSTRLSFLNHSQCSVDGALQSLWTERELEGGHVSENERQDDDTQDQLQDVIQEGNQDRNQTDRELEESSGLDPEVLAALPDDIRAEILAQHAQERREREERQGRERKDGHA